ncbi:hypothetical protein TEA_011989 [Camellia sinensis var. sinensis]|uniref:IP5PC-F beta-propeller domain-containing protein n=1 Tax=Camellia sinensis var. sinensis TaxID=542762 RepID=A0A4S4D281_CAMSN|nr:hypothetical protein TEA_011989 [Camellia sinensis var. sinensis]
MNQTKKPIEKKVSAEKELHLQPDVHNRVFHTYSSTKIMFLPFSDLHFGPGDLWSGSEGGVIKIWPWESTEKSLSLTVEERHMAALIVERSYIDLRSQVTMNGACNIFTSDVKYLLSDNAGAKVWCAGYLSFALWATFVVVVVTTIVDVVTATDVGIYTLPVHINAYHYGCLCTCVPRRMYGYGNGMDSRTRELLKVFNIDGQIENISLVQDPTMEDDVKMKRPQSSFSFFQRSRNAIMGAADAVRRVAVKGAFGDDNRRTEALITTIDGMIWIGCSNGMLVQWDGNGNRLQEFQYHSVAVQCLSTFGSRIWVGYVSGTVNILDLDGNLLGDWVAHDSPVIDMAVGAGYAFTLANHGGIRGWNVTSPGPLDSILRSELAGKEFLYTRIENLKILAGTWNVGQGRVSHDSLISWLGSAAADVGIVVVGLQEVEMGAGFLAMSAAKETAYDDMDTLITDLISVLRMFLAIWALAVCIEVEMRALMLHFPNSVGPCFVILDPIHFMVVGWTKVGTSPSHLQLTQSSDSPISSSPSHLQSIQSSDPLAQVFGSSPGLPNSLLGLDGRLATLLGVCWQSLWPSGALSAVPLAFFAHRQSFWPPWPSTFVNNLCWTSSSICNVCFLNVF